MLRGSIVGCAIEIADVYKAATNNAAVMVLRVAFILCLLIANRLNH
jgi:hypothetical protein